MTHSLENSLQNMQQPPLEPELEGVYLGPLDEEMQRQIRAMLPVLEAVDAIGSPTLHYAAAQAIGHMHHPKHAA